MAYTVYYDTPGTILTYAQMQSALAALASANSWTSIDCGDSAQGTEISGVIIGGGSYTKTALITAGIHGHERVASRAVLDLLNYIDANPSVFPNWRLVVVPVCNPDGYGQNQRKNDNDVTDDSVTPWPRSVDLNRNFARFRGGTHSSTDPASINYQGPAANSEPETQALNALLAAYTPDLVIDCHTTMNQIMAVHVNYGPMKTAVDAAMTTAEHTPYAWTMNWMDGLFSNAADGAGVPQTYVVECGGGTNHLEINRLICGVKALIESNASVTFDSMNNFLDDPNCVAHLRFNTGNDGGAYIGRDWLDKNHFASQSVTASTTVVEGDLAAGATAYPRILDDDLSADFPFKSGKSNLILGYTGWFRPSSLPGNATHDWLITKYDTSSKRSFGLVLYNADGVYSLRAFIGHTSGTVYQSYTLCTFPSLTVNTYFMVGFGYDGADDSWHAEIWSESAQLDSQDGTFGYPIYIVDAPWAIGCMHAAGARSGSTAMLAGIIDEQVWFKEKLSSTKIASIWAQEYAVRTGTLSKTLASATLSATGTVSTASQDISGTLAATLASSTSSSAGTVAIAGASTQTLAASTVSAAGNVPIVGSLAQTLASATLSSSTSSGLSGALASTLANASIASTGTAAIAGSLSASLASSTVAATGAVPIVGVLASTLADSALSSSSSTASVGALASTLQSATVSASGVVPVSGSLSATLADATLSAYFGDSTPAQLTATLASATMEATGEVAVMGALSAALQDAFASSAGAVDIDAECAAILADCFGAIAGRVSIVGSGSATLAGATLSARAGANLVPAASPSRISRVARENRIVRA